MRRKVRRRPVHYVTTNYHDGAVVACHPDRKPSDRKLKEDGLRIDDDLVFREFTYGSGEFAQWEVDFRIRVSDLLANRMNMRRTVRELVLPELANIQAALADLGDRLARIESALAGPQNSQS
ncbi:MAG: hypothetical protein DCC67_13270 [Planctomycetota bacterium]|nr:MAG: hypothetical protein DCC67_13270 [Planctomycetota bacterium]